MIYAPHSKSKQVNAITIENLKKLRGFSKDRRSDVRGALNKIQKEGLKSSSVEKIRSNNSLQEMVLAAELLEAPGGLKDRSVSDLKQLDLWTTYNTDDKSLYAEMAYVSGFLNSWKEMSLKAIGTIEILSDIDGTHPADASGALFATAAEWGSSRYLSYKIAFIKSLPDWDASTDAMLNRTDDLLGHKEHPAIQYSALENLKEKISIFSVARRHTNTLRRSVGTNFRRSHSLGNIVATPVDDDDAASFLRRSMEDSLVDAVYAVWVMENLRNRFPGVRSVLERFMDPEILEALDSARCKVEGRGTENFEKSLTHSEDRSLTIYRQSAAFLEHRRLCEYRNDLDRVIGFRLISSLFKKVASWSADSFSDLDVLRKPVSEFSLSKHEAPNLNLDTFYRTYLFLRFIQEPSNLATLSEDDVKFLFNSTTGLDALLLERELQTFHLNASDLTRPLVSVLALALYRGRSSDPDIDFDYRTKLVSYIKSHHNSDIPEFIRSLTNESPQVANYLAVSLSEATLQKMYGLVSTPQQASNIRKSILNSIGEALNRIEFIIEAEAIETRGKVASLQKYFDTSRMFVDSVAMRDWLETNPSAYTQQYKELLPKLVAKLTAIAEVRDEETGETKRVVPIVQVSSTVDHLVREIAVEAFKEFCINAEFGIESYLGRRIRHNTLHGVMIDPIDGVLTDDKYHPVIAGTPFGHALREWQSFYRNYIERMRKEYLQFFTGSKPNSLFNAELDFKDSATIRSVDQLSKTLQLSGAEMLPDLIIAFCWQQIGPQLDAASQKIRVEMAGAVQAELVAHLEKFQGRDEQNILSELSEAVNHVFSKVASWFRQPETGFISANIQSLCNIIDIEFNREDLPTRVVGNALETEYYGISVHRLYDCLAVLIQNATKHGRFRSPIEVNVLSDEIPNTNLHRIRVAVSSTIREDAVKVSMQRIRDAISSTETGRDMVTEGYSGLKKLKYITKLNEGHHSVEVNSIGNEVEVRFTLKVEVSTGRKPDEENTSD